ncbi:MAG: hypothetical protein ACOCYA_02355 [Spirochaetota bacterium]
MKVIQPLAGGAWQVSIGGKLFAVRSTVPLRAGQTLTTRVTFQDNTVNLRVLSGGTGSSAEPRGAEDSTALNIVLQRSALPINEGIIAALKKAAGGGNFGERLQRMRIAAVLLGKGIEPTDELIDAVIDPLSGRGDARDREDTHGRKGNGQENPDDEETAEDILKAVRTQARRAVESPDHPLQLVNHLENPEGSWIIIPLAVERKGIFISGSLRLLLDTPEGRGWSRGALVVSSGENTWRFVLSKRPGATGVEIIYPEGVNPASIGKTLSDFLEKCEKVGLEIDDKVNRDTVFDGFTSGRPGKNVDTLV